MNLIKVSEEMEKQCRLRNELIREMSYARIKHLLTTGTPRLKWKCFHRWNRMLAKSSVPISVYML